MPEGVLTVLKFCFLALVYLFLWRIVRTVAAELRPSKTLVPVAAMAADAPAPAPDSRRGRRWEMVIVAPPARAGETFSLGEELTVGRAPGCAVVLADDTFVSQVHARLFARGNDPYVEDLGSTNGTTLNGDPLLEPTRLRRGDRVQFGETVMELVR
ncbi:MAG: FHA domain-containing protein [Acidimicrobiia bacterium]|nr:FHA domain-containing protein [Acidimicrobiia bacterium]